MAGSAKRERQLAREHYERQQARRAARAAKRRRNQQITAVVIAVLVIVGGIALLSAQLGGDDEATTATPGSTGSASASASATPCDSASPSASPSTVRLGHRLHVHQVRRRLEGRRPPGVRPGQGRELQEAVHRGPGDRPGRHHDRDGGRQGPVHHEQLQAPRAGEVLRRHVLPPAHDEQHLRAAVRRPHRRPAAAARATSSARRTCPTRARTTTRPVRSRWPTPAPAPTAASSSSSTRTRRCPPSYTIFGTVTKGLDVVQKVADAGSDDSNGTGDGKPKLPITIKTATVGKG